VRNFLALTLAVCGALATPALAGRSMRIDCLPDRLTVWDAADPEPDNRFGAALLPGVVLGPPADSVPYQGAVTVASLGSGGRAELAFDDILIEDAPGPDFIVFENSFFTLPLPTSSSDDFLVFAEPGFVEVSADGVDWRRFPYDPLALAEFVAGGGTIGRETYLALGGLAGLTPTFAGNCRDSPPLRFPICRRFRGEPRGCCRTSWDTPGSGCRRPGSMSSSFQRWRSACMTG